SLSASSACVLTSEGCDCGCDMLFLVVHEGDSFGRVVAPVAEPRTLVTLAEDEPREILLAAARLLAGFDHRAGRHGGTRRDDQHTVEPGGFQPGAARVAGNPRQREQESSTLARDIERA